MLNSKKRGKRGVMGIGTLIIFIASILVAALASGVLIRSTGLLQQRALLVEESARERLVNGLDVIGVTGYANVTTETIDRFDILVRLRAGSTPIRMSSVDLSLVAGTTVLSASLNESISGGTIGASNCTFANIADEIEYCFETRIGNADYVLEADELLTLRYKLNASNALNTQDDFELALLAGSGALEVVELRVPDVILRSLVRIR